jgi:hypothetical protein
MENLAQHPANVGVVIRNERTQAAKGPGGAVLDAGTPQPHVR